MTEGSAAGRIAIFSQALARLEQALSIPEDAIVLDACIQRFEPVDHGYELFVILLDRGNLKSVRGAKSLKAEKCLLCDEEEIRLVDVRN